MAVLDASALIALLRAEPGGAVVRQALESSSSSAITAINLAESIDVLVRVFEIQEPDVADAIDLLEIGGLLIIDIDGRSAWRAGMFRATHYRKGTAELSLADSVAATTAFVRNDPLVTSDRSLARVARAAGIDVISIANRHGSLP